MGKEIARTTFVQEINSSKLFSTRNQVSFRSKICCNEGYVDISLRNHLRSNINGKWICNTQTHRHVYIYISIQIPKYHEIHIINIQKGRQWKVSCAGHRIGYHFA